MIKENHCSFYLSNLLGKNDDDVFHNQRQKKMETSSHEQDLERKKFHNF